MDAMDRMVPSEPEESLARLLNKMESGWGDHFRAQESASEGFLVVDSIPGSGYPEEILSIYVAPKGQLDDEGRLEDKNEKAAVTVKIEIRERGSSEGEEIVITLPKNREDRPTAEDLSKLQELLGKLPQHMN